jgi:hypothetical protein
MYIFIYIKPTFQFFLFLDLSKLENKKFDSYIFVKKIYNQEKQKY